MIEIIDVKSRQKLRKLRWHDFPQTVKNLIGLATMKSTRQLHLLTPELFQSFVLAYVGSLPDGISEETWKNALSQTLNELSEIPDELLSYAISRLADLSPEEIKLNSLRWHLVGFVQEVVGEVSLVEIKTAYKNLLDKAQLIKSRGTIQPTIHEFIWKRLASENSRTAP